MSSVIMGLFDAIFGSSSNMQKWHMRDKVKDHKYFERQLERNLQSKVITEQALIESVENNNNQVDRTFLYWSLAQNAYYNIEIKYSMGGCIKELQTDYLNSLDDFRHGCDINDPIYFEILNRVALGILLKIPNEKFRLLVEYVKRVDEETNPNDWTADMLLWFMLNSHLEDNERKSYAQALAFPCIYMGLYKVTQTTEKEKTKKALNEYLDKWYNLNKNAPWHNTHLRSNGYTGYWAWEVAAVAKIMHIDDTDLKDNPYYPYDMVHWEEDKEE